MKPLRNEGAYLCSKVQVSHEDSTICVSLLKTWKYWGSSEKFDQLKSIRQLKSDERREYWAFEKQRKWVCLYLWIYGKWEVELWGSGIEKWKCWRQFQKLRNCDAGGCVRESCETKYQKTTNSSTTM